MGKPVKVFLVFFLLIAFATFSLLLGKRLYDKWGRKLVYPRESTATQYPGAGKITRAFEERLFIVPRFSGKPYSGEGTPFFADVEDKDKYPDGRYQVFTIPAQEQLLYTVARFEKWEDIDGTLDKYMMARLPSTNELERHRIAFHESSLFKDNPTTLAVEKVEIWPTKSATNSVDKPERARLLDLTYEISQKLIKKGDTVILIPVFDPPETVKTDGMGNSLTSWLIVRRNRGILSFNQELERLLTENDN